MASITLQPGSYRQATVILMRDGVAVGEVVVLAAYERHDGELCVTLGLGLPDDLQAARLDTAPLDETWDGWIAEREAEYAQRADRQHAGHPYHPGHPGASGNSGSYRDPRTVKGGQSSARWRKPDRRDGRPGHNGHRW